MSVMSGVLEGLPVFDSGGGYLGCVADVEDGEMLIDRAGPGGGCLCVPLEWVEEVGDAVFLCQTSIAARAGEPAPPQQEAA
jgi:hypothetical protein